MITVCPTKLLVMSLPLLRAYCHFTERRLLNSPSYLPRGLWLKGWYKLYQLVHNELRMALKRHPLKLSEHTSKLFPIRNTHFRRENSVVLCCLCSLFRRQHFLIQLLTRAPPGE